MDTRELLSPSPDGDYGSQRDQHDQAQSTGSSQTQLNKIHKRNVGVPQPQSTEQILSTGVGATPALNSFARHRPFNSSSRPESVALAGHNQSRVQASCHCTYDTRFEIATQKPGVPDHGSVSGQRRLHTHSLSKSSTATRPVGPASKTVTPVLYVQQSNARRSDQPERERLNQSPAPRSDTATFSTAPRQRLSGHIASNIQNRSHDHQIPLNKERSQALSSTDGVSPLAKGSEESAGRLEYGPVPCVLGLVNGNAAFQSAPASTSTYVNDKIINGPKSTAPGSTHYTGSLDIMRPSGGLIRPPVIPSSMPSSIEEYSYRATAELPVRNPASSERLKETRILPPNSQHYRQLTGHQEPGSGYNVVDGQGHAQQSLRRPSETGRSGLLTPHGHPTARTTASEKLPYWRNGVGYVTASQPKIGFNGLSTSQRPVGFDTLPLSSSHDGLPGDYNSKSSQLSVIIPPPRSTNLWPQTLERPNSRSNSPRRGRPPSNQMPMTPRVEIPIMSSTELGRVQKDLHKARLEKSSAKKRGRPFATPKAAAKAAAKAAGEPNVSRDGHFKKRGRPFKGPLTQANIAAPEPIFNAFVCEWKDCLVELHNAETLRLHLKIVHCKRNPSTKMIPCLWRQCAGSTKGVFSEKNQTQTMTEMNIEFKTQRAWEEHIETAHMLPVLWHQGDGPKGTDLRPPVTLSDKEKSPWLYDAEGRQITPSVQDQKVEMGIARENNKKRFRRRREGMHVVFEPIDSLESYKTVQAFDDDMTDDSGAD